MQQDFRKEEKSHKWFNAINVFCAVFSSIFTVAGILCL